MSKRKRVIGTTREAVSTAETELGRTFPPSFVTWLLENNGIGIREANINIYPVVDKRDSRTSVNSITKQSSLDWYEDFSSDGSESSNNLLAIGEPDSSGDVYCLDYDRVREDGETPVVRLSHENGEIEERADTFLNFVRLAKNGEFAYD